jgi:hypothetical protein
MGLKILKNIRPIRIGEKFPVKIETVAKEESQIIQKVSIRN